MPRPVEPRPLRQHQAKTVFLRVPTAVWGLVSSGKIREFRAAVGNAPQLWNVPLPTLVAAYRKQRAAAQYDYRLLLLEGVRREALGTITAEGLAAAGYEGPDAFARFRREWMIHEKRRFEPLRVVFVYTVRPIRDGDLADAGAALVDHLYGDLIAQEAHTRSRTIQAQRGTAQGARRHGEAIAGRAA